MELIGANLDLIMVAAVMALLLMGYPVAFTLAGSALIFAGLGLWLNVFDPLLLDLYPSRIFDIATNEVLIAVPLFVFMGALLEKSKIAEDLLEVMGALFGRLPGGMGYAVTLVGALLAASTGIVGATVVTMGLLALPTMLRRGYAPGFASGSIAAAGTLGQIIPPSIVLILLGEAMSNAYAKAQREQGLFATETISVGDLFAGALLPGLCLVGLYLLYQFGTALLKPATSPAIQLDTPLGLRKIFIALFAPLILILSVLGSILTGVATPTEGAAIGAMGALFLAALRLQGKAENKGWTLFIALGAIAALLLAALSFTADLRLGRENISVGDLLLQILAGLFVVAIFLGAIVGLLRLFRSKLLQEVTTSTTRTTAMVFFILIGATLFSLVFRGLGGDERISELLAAAPGGLWGALFIVMLLMFVLGFFLDFIEITFIVIPLVAPPLILAGADPIWLGILFALNLQTSFLTPPFGFALFYLRGAAPSPLPTSAIYRGVLPFVLIQLLALFLVALFPAIATWLPEQIYG